MTRTQGHEDGGLHERERPRQGPVQFFGFSRLLLRDHSGDHHRATYDIQDEENGTMSSLYTLVYSQVKQFLTEL